MAMYKYIRNLWKQPKVNLGELWQKKLIEWRRQPVTIRIPKPTRLDRARSLGYKAKQGFIVIRQKVSKGGHTRVFRKKGKRPKRSGTKLTLSMSYQTIAEARANRKYKNCEVLNSYYVAHDGKYIWYEIILIDRDHPQIKADKMLSDLAAKKGRAFRGLTASGRKSRGLTRKGKGAEKLRPSRTAVTKKKLATPRK